MNLNKGQFPRPGIDIRLSEVDAEGVSAIQIFKAGEFNHLYYGQFLLSTAMFMAMIENFKAKVYGIDSMIDYDHQCGEAAGWIKDLYLSDDQQELWAKVAWTPEGLRCVNDKEYRYISGDFSWNYTDNEKGLEYGPLLFGAALTNRPFLKGMAPNTELNDLTGGNHMTLQQLQEQNQKLAEDIKAIQTSKDSEITKLSEVVKAKDADIAKLSEENKGLKEAGELAKKESEFQALLSEGKAVPAQKESFIKGDMTQFAKLAGKLNEKPAGSEGSETENDENADDDEKIIKLAEERFAKGGYQDLGSAISEVRKELKK